ncbi:MAG: FAD-binding oxidoreductase [Sedimentisphaerales bacterium]|nr:FAD-binding oxidoreductase [Sedimentisphaerales bacterium]
MATIRSDAAAGGAAAPDEAAVAQFESLFRGKIIRPRDRAYDEARKLYNAMIDKRPRLIARCADVTDVITAVNFARENDILLAVRGGGHNGAGLGSCDGGLVIDLSALKGIRVDPKYQTVRVEAGCCWREVDRVTHSFGLAVPCGVISTTGVAGLTLGGGHGYLTRKYGLTIDNLLEADVVLADGTFVTTGPDDHEDLFWALRGGGGNFGVVTSFLFKAHPVHTVYAGVTLWPLEQARAVLKSYQDFIKQAPRDLYGFFGFLTVPPGPPFPEPFQFKKMCGAVWCYTGPLGQAGKALEPLWESVRPAFEFLGPMPFPKLQTLFDGLYPPGHQWYWKGDFVRELTDAAIELHLEYGAKLPTPQSTMHLYPIDGAVRDVGAAETAWNCRDATWSMVIVGVDPDPANRDKITQWARDYWEALHPFSAGAAYVNFMMEEGQDRVRATYRDNYDRLVAVKTRYDATNLFRVNQNIKPKT